MSGDSPPVHDPKSKGRSRITNGSALFAEADGRSSGARRMRDIAAALVSDQGGLDDLTQARREIIRRAASLGKELEKMEDRMAQGLAVDLDLYGRLASHQRRLLETLGFDRKAKAVPDLIDLIAEHDNGSRSS